MKSPNFLCAYPVRQEKDAEANDATDTDRPHDSNPKHSGFEGCLGCEFNRRKVSALGGAGDKVFSRVKVCRVYGANGVNYAQAGSILRTLS